MINILAQAVQSFVRAATIYYVRDSWGIQTEGRVVAARGDISSL